MNDFEARLAETTGKSDLHAAPQIRSIQVNIGLKCDLACAHCHVVSSPRRSEVMTWEIMQQVVAAARTLRPCTVDITGGAPELNPEFRRLVAALDEAGLDVLVRTNLTVFFEPGMEGVPEFCREHRVHLVASLPCYQEANVNTQRGDGVFEESIRAIRLLNSLGYGQRAELPLDLVYNPVGPQLLPDQTVLEVDYKRVLGEQHGIGFTRLLTIANMPIGLFWADLRQRGEAESYTKLLCSLFNPRTVDGLMCRHQVCVRWDGLLFDCDFNLALKLPMGNGGPIHIGDFDAEVVRGRRITTGDHCFGCTAGCGSSCLGALVSPEGAQPTTAPAQKPDR